MLYLLSAVANFLMDVLTILMGLIFASLAALNLPWPDLTLFAERLSPAIKLIAFIFPFNNLVPLLAVTLIFYLIKPGVHLVRKIFHL